MLSSRSAHFLHGARTRDDGWLKWRAKYSPTLDDFFAISPYISAISRHIPPYLPISRHIPPYPAISRHIPL